MKEVGVKELSELVEGLMEVSLVLIEVGSDGIQIGDFASLWRRLSDDPRMREKLKEAYEGVGKIEGELRDLDLDEAMGLAVKILPYIPKIVAALKSGSK